MNAISDNVYTQAWAALAKALPRPKAILAISAHWYIHGVALTAMDKPRTIHDFGGFPQELHIFRYPAFGDPQLARRVQKLLVPVTAGLDTKWGLDHGTWSVLAHLFPQAQIPVVQLSIDACKPASFHYEMGRKLAALRDEEVLVIASGNIVHNLHAYSWGGSRAEPYDWAVRFEKAARELILARDHQPLIDYADLGQDALLSIPTPDHYLPLLYILGMSRKDEPVKFPVEGIDGGSVSMLAVEVGG